LLRGGRSTIFMVPCSSLAGPLHDSDETFAPLGADLRSAGDRHLGLHGSFAEARPRGRSQRTRHSPSAAGGFGDRPHLRRHSQPSSGDGRSAVHPDVRQAGLQRLPALRAPEGPACRRIRGARPPGGRSLQRQRLHQHRPALQGPPLFPGQHCQGSFLHRHIHGGVHGGRARCLFHHPPVASDLGLRWKDHRRHRCGDGSQMARPGAQGARHTRGRLAHRGRPERRHHLARTVSGEVHRHQNPGCVLGSPDGPKPRQFHRGQPGRHEQDLRLHSRERLAGPEHLRECGPFHDGCVRDHQRGGQARLHADRGGADPRPVAFMAGESCLHYETVRDHDERRQGLAARQGRSTISWTMSPSGRRR